MKLVLHIGMGKAGSTALQSSLISTSEVLLQHGILYPPGPNRSINHNILICPLVEPKGLPRTFQRLYGDDPTRMWRDFEDFMQGVEALVRANTAETLVLSSEFIFRRLTRSKAPVLKEIMARLSDHVTIVAYVRSPAAFYLSLVQQQLKASSQIAAPKPMTYRESLENSAVIAQNIRVIAYERGALHGADITLDFLHPLSPELAQSLAGGELKQSNETMSAEGMDILQEYRRRNHSGADNVFTKDTDALIKAIAALDAKIEGFQKPCLRDQVRDYVNNASTDLPWLREQHGIVFSDVDYDAISSDLEPPLLPQKVSDVCFVDEDRRDRMRMALLHHFIESSARKPRHPA